MIDPRSFSWSVGAEYKNVVVVEGEGVGSSLGDTQRFTSAN